MKTLKRRTPRKTPKKTVKRRTPRKTTKRRTPKKSPRKTVKRRTPKKSPRKTVKRRTPRKSPRKTVKRRTPRKSVRLPKLNKGTLSRFGYKTSLSSEERHKALNKSIKYYNDPVTIIRKLNAVYVLNKNRSPKTAKIFKTDRDWVSKNYVK